MISVVSVLVMIAVAASIATLVTIVFIRTCSFVLSTDSHTTLFGRAPNGFLHAISFFV